MIFHIGKLQGSNPIILEGVKYIDISNMTYWGVKESFLNSHMDLCIIFNFRSLIEQLALRICKQYKIRNAYLEHGLISMNTTHFKKNKLKDNFFDTLKRQTNFFMKYLCYIVSSKSPIKETKILYNVYLGGKFYKSPFDHYLIYSQRSKDKLGKIYNLQDSNVSFIGYPIFQNKKQAAESESYVLNGVDVLYVHQPFIIDRFTNITYTSEKQYIVGIREQLRDRYGKFVILLHPRENLANYKERFSDTDIEIIQAPNNYKEFANKGLIIGHYSTALLYALYFNKPTVIIEYPGAKLDHIFDECFKYVENYNELGESEFSTPLTTKDYFVGPDNTYEHIASIIKKL